MTLRELFMEFGDPSKTYSDDLVSYFYGRVDDGSWFAEAMIGPVNEKWIGVAVSVVK